jgi:hypothetical protein
MRVKPIFYLPIILQQLLSYSNKHFILLIILHISLFVDFKKHPIIAYRPPIASMTNLPFAMHVGLFLIASYCL